MHCQNYLDFREWIFRDVIYVNNIDFVELSYAF